MPARATAGNNLAQIRREFELNKVPAPPPVPVTGESELRDALQDFERESQRIQDLALEQLGFLQIDGINKSLEAQIALLEEVDRFIEENKDSLGGAGLLSAARVLRTAIRFGEIEITEFQTFGTSEIASKQQDFPLQFFQRRDFLRIATQKGLVLPPSIADKFNASRLTTQEASDFIGPVPEPPAQKDLNPSEVGTSGVAAETADLTLAAGSPVSQFDAIDVARVLIYSDKFPAGTLTQAMRAAEVLAKLNAGDYILSTEQFNEIQRLDIIGAIELGVTEGLRFDRLLLTRTEAQAIITRSKE